MSSKFNHCFVYNGTVYGTIYSDSSVDMMDGTEMICAWSWYDGTNERTARLLSDMTLYWSIITSTDNNDYRMHALKKFYSLAYRLEAVWGTYATRSILDTCEFIF